MEKACRRRNQLSANISKGSGGLVYMKGRQHSGTFSVPNSEELRVLLRKTNPRGSRVKHIRHRREWNAMLKSEQLTKVYMANGEIHSLPSPARFSDCWHPTLRKIPTDICKWFTRQITGSLMDHLIMWHTHQPVLSLHRDSSFGFLVTVLSHEQPARSVWYLRKTS